MKKITLFIAMVVFGLTIMAQSKPTSSSFPSISIENETVNYGTIEKGSNGIKSIKVTNKGGQPLLLTHCQGSCGCTVPNCPREPILPNKSVEIQVNYNTNKIGLINQQISIASNDPQNPNKVVFIRGEVKDTPPQN